MNPYSHLVLASELQALSKASLRAPPQASIQPESPAEYYWGAVVPDVRYLAAMRREQTHISARRILGFLSQYPHLESFLQGYLVHCLADQINLGPIFYRRLPFFLLRGQLSHQHLTVLLELYYLERRPSSPQISGTYNEVLSELGIGESVASQYAQFVRQYATSSSSSRLSELPRLMGLEKDSRVVRYVAAAESFQRNRLLKNALLLGIRAGRISEQIVSRVSSSYHSHTSG